MDDIHVCHKNMLSGVFELKCRGEVFVTVRPEEIQNWKEPEKTFDLLLQAHIDQEHAGEKVKKPFDFDREHDGSLSKESAIFQAIGAASMCWEFSGKGGIFDSMRAKEIGDALIQQLGIEE